MARRNFPPSTLDGAARLQRRQRIPSGRPAQLTIRQAPSGWRQPRPGRVAGARRYRSSAHRSGNSLAGCRRRDRAPHSRRRRFCRARFAAVPPRAPPFARHRRLGDRLHRVAPRSSRPECRPRPRRSATRALWARETPDRRRARAEREAAARTGAEQQGDSAKRQWQDAVHESIPRRWMAMRKASGTNMARASGDA